MMIGARYFIRIVLTLSLCAPVSIYAANKNNSPWHIGILTGIGTTNWHGLVKSHSSYSFTPASADPHIRNGVLHSVPKSADDTGVAVGAYLTWQPLPRISFQAVYQHLPSATIQMDMTKLNLPPSYYRHTRLPKDGRFVSQTEAFSLSLKISQPIAHTSISAFGQVGGAHLYRHDIMAKRGVLSALFGVGFNMPLSSKLDGLVMFSYYTGDDRATVDPVNYYIPYVYIVNVGVSYHL